MLILSALIGGCTASPSPSPTVTRIDAVITASADVNPDFNGQPSSVYVRLFTLKSAKAFQAATFDQLYEAETETLGSDLIDRTMVVLTPDSSSTVSLSVQPDAQVMGVIASYQDPDRATWRSAMAITVNQAASVAVSVNRDAVRIEPGGGA